ncbi:MAG: flavodoxin family protein [Candidatus Omnitrophota bacterium]
MQNIIVLSASPVKNGNTALLVEWFCEGAREKGVKAEVVETAFLKYKTSGCISCRNCQKQEKYECVVGDDARLVLQKMARADVIVMATPLYFYGPSAQLKLVMDRMFSLYKWDNANNTMTTPLKGKKLVLLATAYEDIGLDALEQPFVLTAKYSGMLFESLLVPNAGESGDLKAKPDVKEKAIAFGRKIAE